jgi:murein DD-endopeptidase MepM/ murein hydrolase activator NlpD
MLKKKLTFLFIPDSDGVSRQISIRAWSLYAASLAILGLVFASFYFASAFLGLRVNEAELNRLKAENSQLAQKFENLRWTIAEADARFSQLVQKEVALRSIFGLPEIPTEERQLGVGGPGALNLDRLSGTERMAYAAETEVDRLLTVSEYEIEKFAEAESAMIDVRQRLDCTPSIWPSLGWNSRGFGMMDDPFTGYKRFHHGIDIANHAGTPVVATANGVVTNAMYDGDLGNLVTIDHGFGYVTRYGHMSKMEVKRGQQVQRGQIIGRVGNTGRSTGPHLHYEVWRNGKFVNPRDFILNQN